MKNKKKPFGILKFNKERISNLRTHVVLGGGTSNVNVTRCIDCPSNNPDVACEKTDNPPHHNHGTIGTVVEESSPEAGCFPLSSPDMNC